MPVESPVNLSDSILGVFGTGGFGREVMESLHDSNIQYAQGDNLNWGSLCFVEDEPKKNNVNGIHVKSTAEFLDMPSSISFYSICISNSQVRERLTDALDTAGIIPVSIIDGSAVIHANTIIGPGSVIRNSSIITSNTIIGKSFHANYFSYVAHDCEVGDYVTLGPRATICGNVAVGDHVYIGAGAVIRQGTEQKKLVIGKNAIVGMGAIVTKDVPERAVVVGNPARVIRFVEA
jgi:sugar O-acyltransferase (sialic acid O-acetyltransferase NeuD family)